MTIQSSSCSSVVIYTACLSVLTGCAAFGDKVHVITGTTVGLEFTPPASSENPGAAVMLGYDRAEMALVPTCNRQHGVAESVPCRADDMHDAYSVLALFRLNASWFGTTKVQQVVATGVAAQRILELAADSKRPKVKDPEPKKSQSVGPQAGQTDTEKEGR